MRYNKRYLIYFLDRLLLEREEVVCGRPIEKDKTYKSWHVLQTKTQVKPIILYHYSYFVTLYYNKSYIVSNLLVSK